jgi:hypothetical protein
MNISPVPAKDFYSKPPLLREYPQQAEYILAHTFALGASIPQMTLQEFHTAQASSLHSDTSSGDLACFRPDNRSPDC